MVATLDSSKTDESPSAHHTPEEEFSKPWDPVLVRSCVDGRMCKGRKSRAWLERMPRYLTWKIGQSGIVHLYAFADQVFIADCWGRQVDERVIVKIAMTGSILALGGPMSNGEFHVAVPGLFDAMTVLSTVTSKTRGKWKQDHALPHTVSLVPAFARPKKSNQMTAAERRAVSSAWPAGAKANIADDEHTPLAGKSC